MADFLTSADRSTLVVQQITSEMTSSAEGTVTSCLSHMGQVGDVCARPHNPYSMSKLWMTFCQYRMQNHRKRCWSFFGIQRIASSISVGSPPQSSWRQCMAKEGNITTRPKYRLYTTPRNNSQLSLPQVQLRRWTPFHSLNTFPAS